MLESVTDMKGRSNTMRKAIILCLCLMMTAALMTGCTASAEQYTGEAQGYGGPLRVTVSMSGTDIIDVRVTSHSETEGVGTRAIEALPARIAEMDSVQVDSISGATVTSEAIKAAVSQAIGGNTLSNTVDITNQPRNDAPARTGMGMAATGRLGPGTDADGNPVYSFNVVFACGSFDEDGRVVSLDVDQLEVLSSQFDGFPTGTEDEDRFLSQVSGWITKGAKGEDYMLTSGSWRQQMDAYEDMMTGKTMDEINRWFSDNFSEETGKPNTGDSTTASDMTADAVTGATMSLRDHHGDILTAIQRAWEDAQSRSQQTPGEGGMIDTNTRTDVTDDDSAVG